MTDLSNIDISIDCKELGTVSPWGSNNLTIGMESADMTDFINDHQEAILDWIDVTEISAWLESKGYRVEEE